MITAYVLTFGGLMLPGGRLVTPSAASAPSSSVSRSFTIASILCGVAWDALVIARLLQGVGSAIASPTGLALVATTFPKGPGPERRHRDLRAMTGVGSVMGLVVGGALTVFSCATRSS